MTTKIEFSLPPNIDVTASPIAFGRGAIPKLNDELKDDLLITRQRALVSFSQLLHDPEKVYEAIKIGCVESLKDCVEEEDNTVRFKAAEILGIIATHNLGRNAILDDGVIFPLALLFNDEVEEIRKQAHEAINKLSLIRVGAEGIVDAKLVPILVNKLEEESFSIQLIILDTLHFCAVSCPLSCLDAEIIPVLKSLLTHRENSVKSGAAYVLMDVTIPHRGKITACADSEIIPQLVRLIRECNERVRAHATAALTSIAITTTGKYDSINAFAIPALLDLIDSKSTETRLNAIKALTVLAEAPEGRKVLLDQTHRFEHRVGDLESRAVSRAAEIALKVITWKP